MLTRAHHAIAAAAAIVLSSACTDSGGSPTATDAARDGLSDLAADAAGAADGPAGPDQLLEAGPSETGADATPDLATDQAVDSTPEARADATPDTRETAPPGPDAQETAPPGPDALESAPPADGAARSGKFFMATLLDWPNEAFQYDLFSPFMRAGVDDSRFHVGLNHTVTAAEFDLTERLPHGTRGMEFFTKAEIKAHAKALKDRGYHYVDYDIEPGAGHTPDAEFADFVASIREASASAHAAGLDFHASPANWRLRQGTTIEAVAPLCESLHLQFQGVQDDPPTYLDLAKTYAARARAANPAIRLTIQLSTQQGTIPGKSLVETFKTSWSNVKPHVDGVTIWWSNDPAAHEVIRSFLTWFNQSGR